MADSITLDWLAYTVVGLKDSADIKAALSITEMFWGKFRDDKPINGYKYGGRFFDTGRVCWSDDPQHGVHVSLPSSALAAWAVSVGKNRVCVADLFASIFALVDGVERKIQFTRIDIAFDDLESRVLDFFLIREACTLRCRLTSLFRDIHIPKLDLCRLQEARTIYFGSRRSETFLCIYDKALEQKKDFHWLRVELRLSRGRANAMASRCVAEFDGINDTVHLFADYLYRYLDFKVPTGDSNRRRWPTALWWSSFLDTARKLALKLPKNTVSVERSCGWVSTQVLTTLAFLSQALDKYEFDFFELMLRAGRQNLNERHDAAIRSFWVVADEKMDGDLISCYKELFEFLFPEVDESLRDIYAYQLGGL